MTTLDRYLLRSVLGPTLLALAVLCFLGLALQLNERSSVLIAQVLTLWDMARLATYMTPLVIPVALPLTVLFGILSGYGKLAGRGEITAMRAAGVSLRRLTAPILLFGAVATLLCVVVENYLQPRAIQRAYRLIGEELPRRATVDSLGAGVVHTLGDWRVYFGRSDPAARTIYDVYIVQFETGRAPTVLHTESARVESDEAGQTIVLGSGYMVYSDRYRVATDNFRLRVPLMTIDPAKSGRWDAMDLPALFAQERDRSALYGAAPSMADAISLNKIRREIAGRLSVPFAAIALATLAAPMVLLLTLARGGGRLRVFAAGLIPAIAYYAFQIELQSISLVSLPRAIAIAWLPNAVMFAIGAVLYWRVARVH